MNWLQLALILGMLTCAPSMALGQSCPRPGLPMVIEFWSTAPSLDPALIDPPFRVPLTEKLPVADARFRNRLPSDWPSHWDESPEDPESMNETRLATDNDADPLDPPSPETEKSKRRSRSAKSDSELVVRDPFSGEYVPVSLSPRWGRPYDGDDISDEEESSQGPSQQLLAGSAMASSAAAIAAGISAPALATQSIVPGITSTDPKPWVDRSRYSMRGGSLSGTSQRRSASASTRTTEYSTDTVAKTNADADVAETSSESESEGESRSESDADAAGGASGGSAMGALAGSLSRSVASTDLGINSFGSAAQAQRGAGAVQSSENAQGSQAIGSGSGGVGGAVISRSGGSEETDSGSDDGGFHQPTPPEPTIPEMLPEVPNEDPGSPDGHPGSLHSGLPGETPVVPEPGSLTLLSVALSCGTARWLRRRRKLNEQNPESID